MRSGCCIRVSRPSLTARVRSLLADKRQNKYLPDTSSASSATGALAALEIARREHFAIAVAFKQRARRGALPEAVFEQQPAAGAQVCARVTHDDPNGAQTVGAGNQCCARLEAQVAFAQVRIALGDVGWVGDDQVEALVAQRRAPVALREFDVAKPKPLRIAAGHIQRRRAGIRG